MAVTPHLELMRVRSDPRSISAVAHTISLSFSQDPLIRWLRPTASPWAKHQTETFKWQYRRVQRAILEGIVLQSGNTRQLAESFPLKDLRQINRREQEATSSDEDGDHAGSVALLFPPKSGQKWTAERVILAIKLWLLDWLSPALDQGTNEKRLEKLMNAHNAAISGIKAKYRIENLWYLEVVAVHPLLQARGLGGKAMSWILNYIQDQPMVLECTSERNISFYESLGFRTVEEIVLNDNGESVKYWVMLRYAGWKRESP